MSTHDGWLRATPDMLRALQEAASLEGLNPWKYGSSTIGALKRLGWVTARNKVIPRRYDITADGRAALERDGKYQREQAT